MSLSPYLFLAGNCKAAIAFYQQALDAEVRFQITFAEMPQQSAQDAEGGCAPGIAFPPDSIMHATLFIAGNVLMLSDGNMHETNKTPAGFCLNLGTNDLAEGEKWFSALCEGGSDIVEWQETFWARGFGQVTDQFGVPWMVNVDKPMN